LCASCRNRRKKGEQRKGEKVGERKRILRKVEREQEKAPGGEKYIPPR